MENNYSRFPPAGAGWTLTFWTRTNPPLPNYAWTKKNPRNKPRSWKCNVEDEMPIFCLPLSTFKDFIFNVQNCSHFWSPKNAPPKSPSAAETSPAVHSAGWLWPPSPNQRDAPGRGPDVIFMVNFFDVSKCLKQILPCSNIHLHSSWKSIVLAIFDGLYFTTLNTTFTAVVFPRLQGQVDFLLQILHGLCLRHLPPQLLGQLLGPPEMTGDPGKGHQRSWVAAVDKPPELLFGSSSSSS